MTFYHPRDISAELKIALDNMPVVVVTGMRQTGKTTLLRHQKSLKQRHYTSFDDFAQLEAAKADPDKFVSQNLPLTIDEAHKCPEIFTAIKRAVDKQRTPGQYLLSGSANFSILKNITESLAGRSIYLAINPFNRREIKRRTPSAPFIKRFFNHPQIPPATSHEPIQPKEIGTGSMPTVCLEQVKDPFVWFRGFEQTYLERDVRELSRVGDLSTLRTLLRLTALRTGQLLSPSQLGRDAKLNATTTSRYLSLFEASFLIHRIPPYLKNRASRLIKSPKLYFSDSGIAGYLAGIEPSASINEDTLYGALFETFVAQNLVSILNAHWNRAALCFWSIQGRHEVDFVIDSGKECIALELKAAARWQDKNLSGLKAFLKVTPHCKAGILCYNGREAVRLGEKLWALPVSLVLS